MNGNISALTKDKWNKESSAQKLSETKKIIYERDK